MLNEWVFDARLMEQQVTGLFILFHTNTTFIDRPTDSVALRDSDHSLVLASSVRPSFVRCCVLCPMFYVPTTLTPSSIVYIVYCSFVVFCVPSVALYILKSGVPFQGLSANRHIWLFGPDESRRPTHQGFSSQLPFVLDATF